MKTNQSSHRPIVPSSVVLMGVKFTHLTLNGVVEAVALRIAKREYARPLTVFTPNVEQLMQTREEKAFLRDLMAADITIPDSIGLTLADWWRAACTGKEWLIRERVAGSDVAEELIFKASNRGWKVVLVGGMDSVAEKAGNNLKKRFSGLEVYAVEAGTVGETQDDSDDEMIQTTSCIKEINKIKPDLLLVGFGAPKQERWVLRNRSKLQAQVVMVVGGTLDGWADKVKRAPMWWRKIGFEWLWRLMQEPWRINRQLRLVRFVGAVVRGKW